LAACDGTRTATSLAAELAPTLGASSQGEVFELIDGLCRKGLAVWKLEVPLDMRPERHLRELLAGVADDELREPALAMLDRLDAGRDAASRATGAAALASALTALDATFSALTGKAATHSTGKTYAGRTV